MKVNEAEEELGRTQFLEPLMGVMQFKVIPRASQ